MDRRAGALKDPEPDLRELVRDLDDSRRGRSRRGHRPVWRRVAIAMSAVMVAACLSAYGFYRHFEGNIKKESVKSTLGKRPAKLNKALNILLIGSDVRTGENAKYGSFGGKRSDTTILLHISPNGSRALLVSFPRDSMVQIPAGKACGPGQYGMINVSFFAGGAACTWKTVEHNTGIHIDHFVEVDFTGFRRMVDALGGVEICLPRPINSAKAQLRLPGGKQVVDGEEGLGFVRLRDVGDGSDIGRIKRQQLFMAAMVKKATSSGLLTNPPRLYAFLEAATKSIKTDDDLSIMGLRQIANSVKGMDTGRVRFVTVPWQPLPTDPNRIRWAQPHANELFEAIKNDAEVTPGQPGVPKPKLQPNQIRVRVLNGTNTPGLANEAATRLKAYGFQITKVGNAGGDKRYPQSVIKHPTGDQDTANVLGNALQSPARLVEATSPPTVPTVTVIIGSDWKGVKPVVQLPKNLPTVSPNTDMCKVRY